MSAMSGWFAGTRCELVRLDEWWSILRGQTLPGIPHASPEDLSHHYCAVFPQHVRPVLPPSYPPRWGPNTRTLVLSGHLFRFALIVLFRGTSYSCIFVHIKKYIYKNQAGCSGSPRAVEMPGVFVCLIKRCVSLNDKNHPNRWLRLMQISVH